MFDAEGSANTLNLTPIFIVGAPRSGTTLVASILGRHYDVFAPGESHYFEDVWTRQKELGSLTNKSEICAAVARLLTIFGRFNFAETQELVNRVVDRDTLVKSVQTLGGGYGTLYYAFMSTLARSDGKWQFCDDTPKHLYHLPAIFQLFPQAKVIGCVRDPRDFLCSYKNYWHKSKDASRVKALYHPVLTSLLWRSSSDLLLRYEHQFGSSRVLVVRYEDLVEHPSREIRRICSFLKLEYADELTNVETHNSSFESPAGGIFTTSMGRWHACLKDEETWWAQTLAIKYMTAFGYQVEKVNPVRLKLLLHLAQSPLATVRALFVNRHKRGPLLKYLVRRLSVLVE